MTIERDNDMSISVIPAEILDSKVEGVNLRPGVFRDQLAAANGRTLLIFLRHFG